MNYNQLTPPEAFYEVHARTGRGELLCVDASSLAQARQIARQACIASNVEVSIVRDHVPVQVWGRDPSRPAGVWYEAVTAAPGAHALPQESPRLAFG